MSGRRRNGPNIVHLYAEVDVEDTDEVLDVVIDRLVDMQAEEGLPIFVIPVQTPERIAAGWESRRREPQRTVGF